MRTLRPFGRALVAALALVTAGSAAAHPGHDAAGLLAGLAHPLSGADHLLAMLAVGLWSAIVLPAGRRWAAPALFVGVMALAALAVQGWTAPSLLEPALAASVIAMGALLAGGRRIAAPVGLAIIAAAAALHGAAHGLEIAPGASALAFGSGFVVATAALHAAGLAAAPRLQRAAGVLGALVSGAGLLMLLSRV